MRGSGTYGKGTMKFTVAGSRIICSRIDNTVAARTVYRRVVQFDSQVDTVPPHVAAKLTRGEIRDLESFLADRRRIKADPSEINMLEVAPQLVDEVTEIIESIDCLNGTMYRRVSESVARLAAALEEVKPSSIKRTSARRLRMNPSEALKQRLERISRDR